MRGQDNGLLSFSALFSDRFPDLPGIDKIDSVCRFAEKNDARIVEQSCNPLTPLPLTKGKLPLGNLPMYE